MQQEASSEPRDIPQDYLYEKKYSEIQDLERQLKCAESKVGDLEGQFKSAQVREGSLMMELKTFKEAYASEVDKSAAMSLKLDEEIHRRKVVEAWGGDIKKLIKNIDLLIWEQLRSPVCSDFDSVQKLLLKYMELLDPLIHFPSF